MPWAIWIGKENLDDEPLAQRLVLGHLFPRITGHGFAQQHGHVSEFLGEALRRTRGIAPVHPGEDTQACGPAPPACGWLTHCGPPLIRSPSQWPDTVLVATSGGRLVISVIVELWPRRLIPCARGRRALRTCRSMTNISLGSAPRGNTYSPALIVSDETCVRMSS